MRLRFASSPLVRPQLSPTEPCHVRAVHDALGVGWHDAYQRQRGRHGWCCGLPEVLV